MEYILMCLLILLLICMIVLILLVKKQNETRSIQDLLVNQDRKMEENQIEKSFMTLFQQVQELKKDQVLSKDMMNRVQTDLSTISTVMTNTKRRGNWGEYQLNLLMDLYTAKNPNVYSTQYTLLNGKIADVVLHMPGSNKVLCIDSKFPMENYLNLLETEDENFLKIFRNNIKKHIDDVANKYITSETMDQAILFIPSEAIYQFICSESEQSLNYALQKHVLLASPTTLVGILYTLIASTQDFYRAKNIKEIERNILLLQEDVDRLLARSTKAEKSLESLVDQFHQVSISAQKISNRMDKMMDGREVDQ